jgi:AAHS family 4-hydroxybenzoate transporter-like MFS transporter
MAKLEKKRNNDIREKTTMRAQIRPLIDSAPIGAFQFGIFVVCGLIALVDGFDNQAIAFAAPAIAAAWNVSASSFGLAFGIGLFGTLLGAMFFGPLADRFGRRSMLGVAVCLFGLTSLGTAFGQSIEALMVWRFLTGIGGGGALPCLGAITSEYAPKRLQATIVTTMFAGVPLGAVLGGILSAQLIGSFGWTSIFMVGAFIPLALVPLIYAFLPESLQTQVSRAGFQHKARRILVRIVGAENVPQDADFALEETKQVQPSPLELFGSDLRAGSLLICVLFFAGFMLAYFLMSWTPLLLHQSGLPVALAIYGTALLSAGGIVGSVVISWLSDRYGVARVLPVTYVLGALAVGAVGMAVGAGLPASFIIFLIFIAGLLCLPLTIFAVVALFYPPALCATGLGVMGAVGRIGSIVGTVGAGFLISGGSNMVSLFWIAAIPAVVSAVAVAFLKLKKTTGQTDSDAGPVRSEAALMEGPPVSL